MASFTLAGILFLVLGLVALIKPDILKPFYGWQSRVMGAKVTPPKSFSIQYRIAGGISIILGLFLLYVGLK